MQFKNVKAILTDIEGTTSSITFVKDILFPYAARMIPEYLYQHQHKPEVKEVLRSVAKEANIAVSDLNAIISVLLQWINEDKKITPLKTLQGMVWEQGYRNGDYQAHVYVDAYETLSAWHQQGLPIYIYSSGSVQAQKLFFTYSEFGDMTKLFSGNFDTRIGGKQDESSYRSIAKEMGFQAHAILFLSDIPGELEGARKTGMQTACVVRPEESSMTVQDQQKCMHPCVQTFSELVLN